jgi:hypothetical protein
MERGAKVPEEAGVINAEFLQGKRSLSQLVLAFSVELVAVATV